MKLIKRLCLLLVPVILLAGCTSAINSGHIVSVTERGFGILIAQSTQNQTPEIKLGFFSSAVVLEPVTTNGTLTAPNFANTFAIDQSTAPFNFGVDETIASGNYMTGNPLNSTNASMASKPIVPGLESGDTLPVAPETAPSPK